MILVVCKISKFENFYELPVLISLSTTVPFIFTTTETLIFRTILPFNPTADVDLLRICIKTFHNICMKAVFIEISQILCNMIHMFIHKLYIWLNLCIVGKWLIQELISSASHKRWHLKQICIAKTITHIYLHYLIK